MNIFKTHNITGKAIININIPDILVAPSLGNKDEMECDIINTRAITMTLNKKKYWLQPRYQDKEEIIGEFIVNDQKNKQYNGYYIVKMERGFSEDLLQKLSKVVSITKIEVGYGANNELTLVKLVCDNRIQPNIDNYTVTTGE